MYAVAPLARVAIGPPAADRPLPAPALLPREEVFKGRDAWQAAVQHHLLALHCSVVDAQGFKCDAVIAKLCGNTLAEWRVDAARLERRAADANDTAGRQVQLVWQLAGRSRIQQGPNSATLHAGHWTLCDTGRPYALDFEHSARCMLLLLPQAQCAGWLQALDTLAGLALPATGPAHIAQHLLALLLRGAAALDGRSERALQDAVVALVEQGLRAELERRGATALARRSPDGARLQAYVLEHLGDKRLSVDRIAAAFGLSRRTLYNLFVPLGVTPHAFIQTAKLDRASSLLRNGSASGVPVVRIAEQCGFADAAHFSRAFHARYGASPSAWRGKR